MKSVDDLIRAYTAQKSGTLFLVQNPREFISLLKKDLIVASNYVNHSLNADELKALLANAYQPSLMGLSCPFFSQMIAVLLGPNYSQVKLETRSDLIITLLERLDDKTRIDPEDLFETFRILLDNKAYDVCAALLRHLSCDSAVKCLTFKYPYEVSSQIKVREDFRILPADLLQFLITRLPKSSIALSQAIAVLNELHTLDPAAFVTFIQQNRTGDLVWQFKRFGKDRPDLVNQFYAINPEAIRTQFPQASKGLPLALAPPPSYEASEANATKPSPSAPPVEKYENLTCRLPSVPRIKEKVVFPSVSKDKGGLRTRSKMTKDYISVQNVVIDALDDFKHSLRAFFQPDRNAQIVFEEKLKSDYQNQTNLQSSIEPYRNFYRSDLAARQLYGAIQPFVDIWKRFSLFKTNKTDFQAFRDFLPVGPLMGLVNIFKGLGILALTPMVSAVYLIGDLGHLHNGIGAYLKQNLEHFGFAASWLLNGVGHLIQGATEIAFIPLFAIRFLACATSGFSGLTSNQGLKFALTTAQTEAAALDDKSTAIPAPLFASLYELHRKRIKADARRQPLIECQPNYISSWEGEANSKFRSEEKTKFAALLDTKVPVKQRVDDYIQVYSSRVKA